MGYDLHITRADHWVDNAGREIKRGEWLALVAGDPELTLDPDNGDDFALWTQERSDLDSLIWLKCGNISTKNPDEATIAKMVQLAGRLRARVQGDDGEFYDSPRDSRDE